MIKNKVELLAPSGSLEKGQVALNYGADAIYLGAKAFSLRARASNFDEQQLKTIRKITQEKNKRWYLVTNILCQNHHLKQFPIFLKQIKEYLPDGFIASDPFIIKKIHETYPQIPIHVSTQQSVTNSKAALFFSRNHCSRIILSREVSYPELVKLIKNVDNKIEIEIFVHGAVCIGYSGRCMLSNNFCLRDANIGGCAQSCRWKTFLSDKQKKYAEIFTMSAKDMCLINYLPQLIDAGVASFKIEGRMKSEYYLATIISNYRKVIDQINAKKKINKQFLLDVENAANRPTDTAWYFGNPGVKQMLYHDNERKVVQNYAFKIIKKITNDQYEILVMNHMKKSYQYQILDMKTNEIIDVKIKTMVNQDKMNVEVLPTPISRAEITLNKGYDLVVGDIGRIKS